jgi:hypothetical protein
MGSKHHQPHPSPQRNKNKIQNNKEKPIANQNIFDILLKRETKVKLKLVHLKKVRKRRTIEVWHEKFILA